MNAVVKKQLVVLVGLLALIAFRAMLGFASEQTDSPPAAFQRADRAEVVSRARSVFVRFATACLAHDQSGIGEAVTDDVVVEYALPDPGITLSVYTAAPDNLCAAAALAGNEQMSNVYIYPTNDPNTIFVQYDTASSHARSGKHLTVVTLRGDRISRIRDFATAPGEVASLVRRLARNEVR